MRDKIKELAGRAVVTFRPSYRYEQCIFMLAHMRCGSTALSNIICSRAEVSGYGEAHIRYDDWAAPGRLVVNQAWRGAWTYRSPYLFDKILHSRHDGAPPRDFFGARAIFIAREPSAAVRSIRDLYSRLGRDEYNSDVAAAAYYVGRLDTLLKHWSCFPVDRRVAVSYDELMASPERCLAKISETLSFAPPLENKYVSVKASRRGGAGDPLVSGQHEKIVRRPTVTGVELPKIDVPAGLLNAAEERYHRFIALTAGQVI